MTLGLQLTVEKYKITDIAAIPQSLAAMFNDWLNRYNSDEVDNKHIEEGKNLAKEIKNYLPKDIRLKYYFAPKNAQHCEKSISI
jgi:hypothetical protein